MFVCPLTVGAVTEQVFDQGRELGFRMCILDIGGGFAGGSFDNTGTVQLGRVPIAVNAALDTFFPDPSVKVSWHWEAHTSLHILLSPLGLRSAQQSCTCLDLHSVWLW